MKRSDAIKKAFDVWLESARAELDTVDEIRCIVLDLRFSPGALEPRNVIDRIEKERRRDPERKRA